MERNHGKDIAHTEIIYDDHGQNERQKPAHIADCPAITGNFAHAIRRRHLRQECVIKHVCRIKAKVCNDEEDHPAHDLPFMHKKQ